MDAVTQERDLLEKRARVYDGMRAIMEKMEQGIELDKDDRSEFDKRNAKITKLNEDIERIRQYARLSAGATEAREEAETRDERKPAAQVDEERAYEIAFLKYLRDGDAEGMTPEQRKAWRMHSKPQSLNYAPSTRTYMAGHDTHGTPRITGYPGLATRTISYDGAESRAALDANALSTNPNSAGVAAGSTGYDAGYLVPQGFWHNLQIALKAYGGLLPYIQLLQTDSGQPMPWPTVDPTAVVARYITESNQTGFGGDGNGTDYQFGQGMLNAWTLISGVILASLQLINDSAFDVDGFVNDRIGESIGRKVAAEIHTGTGSNAFLGVETALNTRGAQSGPAMGGVYKSGTSTKWAATAGGNAFTITGGTSGQAKLANGLIGFDDVLGMISTVDPAYRNSGRCLFVANDLTLAMLRQITDAYGHPLWSPAVAVGQPDTLYGFPVIVDQNTSAVSTNASTSGGLLFGDFKTALVGRQVNGASMMRLTERYADYLQVGYLGYCRMDVRSNDLRAAAIFSTNAT
jgi:HK97 family phage major capsid protein